MLQLQAVGNIGKDAVVIESSGNKFVAFNIAQTDKYKNKKGETVEKTTWVKCYGNYDHLKNLTQYLLRGTKVFIQGVPSFHKWKNETTKQMEIDLRCTIDKIQLLSPKKEDSKKEETAKNEPTKKAKEHVDESTGEITPFFEDEFTGAIDTFNS